MEPDVDDDDEEDLAGHSTAAFERQYLDDRSWELLREDEHGRLVASSSVSLQRKRLRSTDAGQRIRRGMIRYLQLVLDMSESCAASTDMIPNRAAVLVTLAKQFIAEFFDQNPLSQLSVAVLRAGAAFTLTDMSASPEAHRRALSQPIDSGGAISLQNMLELCSQTAALVPPYGHREALILLSSLTSCDPGAIAPAIDAARAARLRVSLIGLSAEMFVSTRIARETGGRYRVALSEVHLRELLMAECLPPAVAAAAAAPPHLVRMGFPRKEAEGPAHAAFAGEAAVVATGTYVCPICASRSAAVPCECHVCGVTLILSPHLARSYHHLFPVPPFEEVALEGRGGRPCAFCGHPLASRDGEGAVIAEDELSVFRCGACHGVCCAACDEFVHDHLHNCPGCEAITGAASS